MALTVTRKGSDPFKKYWWLVLLIFLLMGAWSLFPTLGGGVAGLDRNRFLLDAGALKPLDQSLDALNSSPIGASAPGGALGGAVKSGAGGGSTDPGAMLYRSPAAGAASAAPAAAPLADALGEISRRPGGAMAAAPAAAAASPYSIPSAKFAPIAMGGGGGGSGAGYGAGGSAGLGAFGTVNARPGISAAQGMSQDMAALSPKGGAFSQLKAAAGSGAALAGMTAGSAAKGMSNSNFDGSGGAGVALPETSGGGFGATQQGLLSLAAPAPGTAQMTGGAMPPAPMASGPSKQKQMLMMLMMAGAMGLMMAATGGSASMIMPMMAMQMMPMMMGMMTGPSGGYGGGYGG